MSSVSPFVNTNLSESSVSGSILPPHQSADSQLTISHFPNHADWNDYPANHPRGSVFHTLEMYCSFLGRTRTDPVSLSARNRDGKIVAMLSAVFVDTLDLFKRWSTRSIMFAEPICDPTPEGRAGLRQLLKEHDRIAGNSTLFTEIRCLFPPSDVHSILTEEDYSWFDYDNYLQDLTVDLGVMKSRMKSQMRKIKTAHKRGLVISQHNDQSGVERAYRIIKESYRRSQVPCLSKEIFENAMHQMPPGRMQVRVAELDGQDVAAAIGLVYGDRFYAWHNGTTRPKGISATAAIVWDEIQEAKRLGLVEYDFGGAGWAGQSYGPRTFKARFKGNLVNYGRYRRVHSKFRFMIAKGVFEVCRKFQLFHGSESANQST